MDNHTRCNPQPLTEGNGDEKMITKSEVREGTIGEKKGYCFEVYYDNREYPNFISSLVKTKLGSQRNLLKYIRTGKFSLYGNAE